MANYIYGIDIGGTTVKMGLFDEEGTMIDKWEIVTHKENGGEQILPDIAASIKEKYCDRRYSWNRHGCTGTDYRRGCCFEMRKSRLGNLFGGR